MVDVGNAWEVCWRRGIYCYILTQSSSDRSNTSSHSGWAVQQWVTEGPSPLSEADSHSARILFPSRTATRTASYPKLSVAPGYIIVKRPPASCGRTHLHRIQPRPRVKVIFRYLWPNEPVSAAPLLIYTGASIDWRLGRESICYTSSLRVWLELKNKARYLTNNNRETCTCAKIVPGIHS